MKDSKDFNLRHIIISRIDKKGYIRKKIAEKINLFSSNFSDFLNGKRNLRVSKIEAVLKFLDLYILCELSDSQKLFQDFRSAFKFCLEQFDISQIEASKSIGINATSFSKYLNGKDSLPFKYLELAVIYFELKIIDLDKK